MRYLSLFSGIEACSVAWKPLGWECVGVAELEPFPCAVLAHHYPGVPNLGDVTKITDERIADLGPIDLVVGGSPCQDLSVAGKRAGLAGARSGLFHEQLRIFHAARHLCGARFLLWENVPGAFSSNAGRDFALVVGAMAGCELDVPAEGWGNEGMALGESGLVEWAVLDAQFFGVAQRRRRVFALLDTGDWRGRPPVLLEPEGMRGDSAPRREAGEGVAAGTLRSTDGGSDVDHAAANHLVGVGECVSRGMFWNGEQVTQTLDAVLAKGQTMPEKNRFPAVLVPEAPIAFAQNQRDEVRAVAVAGALAAEPGMKQQTYIAIQNATRGKDQNGLGVGAPGEPMYTLDGASQHAIAFAQDIADPLCANEQRTYTHEGANNFRTRNVVAFSAKDHGADAGEIAPTLRSMGHDGSHANGGRQVAVCVTGDRTHALNTANNGKGCSEDGTGRGVPTVAVAFESRFVRNGRGAPSDVVPPLKAQSGETGKGDAAPLLATTMQVRRLTPRECERLQGFPDDYTLIPHRGKPAADGPRYKALGNSMAVPVMRWIGEQIQRALTAASCTPR